MKGKLTVLMITAFVDMLGLAMIIPLLPFYATKLGASATVVGILIAAFSISGEHGILAETGSGAIWSVIARPKEPAQRLIWIYAIAIGAFYGTAPTLPLILSHRLPITEGNVGFFVMYLGGMGVFVRAGLLGRMIEWLGEAQLTRLGLVLLAAGLALIAAVHSYLTLLVSLTLMPLGTAFVFPCVTAMLSRVVAARNRGLYMGVQHTFGGVSRVMFPLAAGVAMDHLGLGFPFVIAGVLVLATLLLTTSMEDYAASRAPSMT